MTEQIRKTVDADRTAIWNVHHRAFGQDEEAQLAENIMADPTAQPTLSLIATIDTHPMGHILFSSARLDEAQPATTTAILAPLAILPEHQSRGVGGRLIDAGLRYLRDDAVDLVFVLGHPEYYPRHGFEPAGRLGIEAPYPIPQEHAAAWMVQALKPGLLGTAKGRVACCDALNRREYWVE